MIEELFPPGDPCAEWTYSLTVLADDLAVITSQLKPALERQRLRETLFFARQLFTRIYEARRLIAVMDARPEIEAFALGPRHDNPWAKWLLEVYRAGNGEPESLVERTYGVYRHQTVHIMWPGSKELGEALAAAGPLPARIYISPDGPVNQWVHAVSGMLRFGDLGQPDWMRRFKQMNDLAGQIASAWLMLSGVVLVAYAHERGIELARLHVDEE